MSYPLSGEDIAHAFLSACRAELYALKPGNVHVHGGGHGMEIRQFEEAAAAAAPWIATAGLKIGARVLAAVEASMVAAGCNTNLGILLLAAPLAAAAGIEGSLGSLQERLRIVLSGLDRDDAANVFEAIRCANPAGLGTVEAEDVAHTPTQTLLEAMGLAAARDRIARAYVSDFADVFDFGLPALRAARCAAASENDAVTTLHMSFLAEFPDSHIARKHGQRKGHRGARLCTCAVLALAARRGTTVVRAAPGFRPRAQGGGPQSGDHCRFRRRDPFHRRVNYDGPLAGGRLTSCRETFPSAIKGRCSRRRYLANRFGDDRHRSLQLG